MIRATSVLTVLALVLVAGCAGPSLGVSGSGPGEDGSALPTTRDIAGTWHGSYWQLGMVYYADDADWTLQINEDSRGPRWGRTTSPSPRPGRDAW